jgi:hypothetical protein
MKISKRVAQVTKSIRKILGNNQDGSLDNDASVIYNFVEDSSQEIAILKKENQDLKDDVNRLKGEDGKPNIKGKIKTNQDGVSSEEERKLAEELANDKEKNIIGYKFDKPSLEKLEEQNLPKDILNSLKDISGNKYSSETEFILAVEEVIGKESTDSHSSLLLKYAKYKKRNRIAKIPNIEIDRCETCLVDKSILPDDAIHNGYAEKVVQDIILKTDNVKFRRESYYSPSLKKTYTGQIPDGYEGDFGPHINSYIVSMKYINGMSIPKIAEFYKNMGTKISPSYISLRLSDSKHINVFHEEKSAMYKAGLEVSSYNQIDDTGTRVNGENRYTQILCNDVYTAFFTTKRKDRLTILDVLRNFESREFLLNDQTFPLLSQLGVCKKHTDSLQHKKSQKIYNEEEILDLLSGCDGLNSNSPRIIARILEACAISSYRQQTGITVVKILVSDDAPQFKLLTDELALCWIHEGRHYKRLNPVIVDYQEELDSFLKRYWEFYSWLLMFKNNPNQVDGEKLSDDFDNLFSTKTRYDSLNNRIAKTKSKKTELLVVLNSPEIPLHNNLSENAARVEKRRRDVSLQTKSEEGTKAKDTMMSIVETCKKLGVNGYRFIHDRVSNKLEMPSLAVLIKERSVQNHSP